MGPDELIALVDEHSAALTLYARQWCSCPEDVLQSAFLKLMRQTVPPEKILPWLYRVVRNEAIDASRASRRRQQYEHDAAAYAPLWFVPSEDPSGLDARLASQALSELPIEIREIMVAHLWGGLTFEQIAATVGSSASTAYRRFALGLDLLRLKLGVSQCPTLKTPKKVSPK